MKQETNQKYLSLLLQTMKDFDNFCNQNNFRYYACGGTAIGAVRHQGLIPWDDDIDVYMPREDYNKFLSLKNKAVSDYEIIDIRDKGYYVPFAKFSNKKTTIWEYQSIPFIFGVYIDVFPLDSCNGDITFLQSQGDSYKILVDKYVRSLSRHRFREYLNLWKKRQYKEIASLIWDVTYHRLNRIRYHREILAFEEELAKQQGEFYYCYGINLVYPHEVFPKEWFDEYIMMPFENISVRMPIGYKQYLEQQFGDYMTPPPVENRVSHHPKHHLDLERRLTIKQINHYQKNI